MPEDEGQPLHLIPLYVAKGQWITCERGHRIAQAYRDIFLGDTSREGDFVNWVGPEPKIGEQPDGKWNRCPRWYCRKLWFHPGMILHLEDGWAWGTERFKELPEQLVKSRELERFRWPRWRVVLDQWWRRK